MEGRRTLPLIASRDAIPFSEFDSSIRNYGRASMQSYLAWFLPSSANPLQSGHASVVVVASVALILTIFLLLIFWKLTKDLQRWTVIVSAAIVMFLGWLIFLCHLGLTPFAAGLLITLMLALLVADVMAFGISSVGGSFMVAPILLAEFGLGTGTGWILAGVCACAIWMCAWREASGKLASHREQQRDTWTFQAPALTALFLLVEIIASTWSAVVTQALIPFP
jgi:hypothetical protein